MAQQTAVSWLQIQLRKGIDFNPLDPLSYPKAVDNLFEQAKQIEKEQIAEAFYEGMKTNPFDPNRGRGKMYYEETYKKE